MNFRKSCEINEIVDEEEAPDENVVDDEEVTEDVNEVEENDVDVEAGPDHCLISGSCHFDRASNDKSSVKF